jgi:hypothetical protein
MLEVEEAEELGWNWSEGGDVLADVLPDVDWLPDVDRLGLSREGHWRGVRWPSDRRVNDTIALVVKNGTGHSAQLFSTNARGFEETHSPSVSEKLSALVNTKYQVNVVYGIIRMVHGSLIVSSGAPVAMLHAQKQVNLGGVRQPFGIRWNRLTWVTDFKTKNLLEPLVVGIGTPRFPEGKL